MGVRVEQSEHVTTVIHSRPHSRNAMDTESAESLVQAFTKFEEDPNARVAVFWGEGGAFCAGWDLKMASALVGKDKPLAHLDFPDDKTIKTPRGPMGPSRMNLTKPVICAIAGPAVAGGMELALWCDLRVMESSSYMGVYCRRWGVPLIDGGTVRLPRLVGQGRALDIIMTGRKIPAEEALQIGLCERVVPDGRSREEAEKLAHEISRFPQECMNADRRSVYLQHGLPVDAAMEAEWNNSIHVLTEEGIEGANRFKKGQGRHGDFKNI